MNLLLFCLNKFANYTIRVQTFMITATTDRINSNVSADNFFQKKILWINYFYWKKKKL